MNYDFETIIVNVWIDLDSFLVVSSWNICNMFKRKWHKEVVFTLAAANSYLQHYFIFSISTKTFALALLSRPAFNIVWNPTFYRFQNKSKRWERNGVKERVQGGDWKAKESSE